MMTSKFYSLPLRPAGAIYFEPRDLFDSAVIGLEGVQVVYDENRLLEILIDDYRRTVEQLSNYRFATDEVIRDKSEKLAIKWLITMRHSSIYGDINRRPIIRPIDEQS